MDTTRLASSLGAGFATGLSTLLIAVILLMPLSYVMNKFIYHSVPMRLVLGFITFILPVLAFIAMIVIRVREGSPIHYFGLIPVSTAGAFTLDNPYFSFIDKIVNTLLHPLLWSKQDPIDADGYTKAIGSLLAKPGEPVVSTEIMQLFKESRALAGVSDINVWKTKMDALVKTYGTILTNPPLAS